MVDQQPMSSGVLLGRISAIGCTYSPRFESMVTSGLSIAQYIEKPAYEIVQALEGKSPFARLYESPSSLQLLRMPENISGSFDNNGILNTAPYKIIVDKSGNPPIIQMSLLEPGAYGESLPTTTVRAIYDSDDMQIVNGFYGGNYDSMGNLQSIPVSLGNELSNPIAGAPYSQMIAHLDGKCEILYMDTKRQIVSILIGRNVRMSNFPYASNPEYTLAVKPTLINNENVTMEYILWPQPSYPKSKPQHISVSSPSKIMIGDRALTRGDLYVEPDLEYFMQPEQVGKLDKIAASIGGFQATSEYIGRDVMEGIPLNLVS
jgi:hypothetical protein